MSLYIPITVQNFKEYFYRDFPYSASQTDYTGIVDADIQKAFKEAAMTYNQNLFDKGSEQEKVAFGYLTAHYLVIDIANSTSGLSSKFQGYISSKSVGSVSVGMNMPSWITDNPILGMLGQTGYGAKYLALVMANMVGNVAIAQGATHP